MVRAPTHRPPIHPGEILLEEFLKPLGVTQRGLAEAIQVPYQRVINDRWRLCFTWRHQDVWDVEIVDYH